VNSPSPAARSISSSELYRRLLRYVAPYRGVFSVAILGAIVVALTEPALPAIMKPLFDGVFVARDSEVIRWMPLAIIGIVFVRGVAEYAATYCIAWAHAVLRPRSFRQSDFQIDL
jgi:subfamily B ATP-binding cassette protein MsbA